MVKIIITAIRGNEEEYLREVLRQISEGYKSGHVSSKEHWEMKL